MYQFKCSNGIKKTIEINGFNIAGELLKNISINISFSKKGHIYAWLNEKDKLNLKTIEYEHFLIEAQIDAYNAIKTKNYSIFSQTEDDKILDIIDKNNYSYYDIKKNSKKNQHLTNIINKISFSRPIISVESFNIFQFRFESTLMNKA